TASFSGDSSRATYLFLNDFPYRAKSFSHHCPLFVGLYRGDMYSDAGGFQLSPKNGVPEKWGQVHLRKNGVKGKMGSGSFRSAWKMNLTPFL
ncbi:hypothetical protein, partial [Roseateles sp.]|uniref:hypothetical protein n=1 Tax=Roseateles sp. TaxID=1971397 RepID=UPI00286C608E